MNAKVINDLFEIAVDLEPSYINWSYGEHEWCFNFVEEGEIYLNEKGIKTRKSYLNSNLFQPSLTHHVWLELEDGLIIDPTIKQFFLADKNYCQCLTTCKKCQPKLSKRSYSNSSFWLVDHFDPRRNLYLYLGKNGDATSAKKAAVNPYIGRSLNY